MSPINVFLLLVCMMASENAGISTMGNFFHEHLPDSNEMKDTATISFFLQESFHFCSLKEECNYVIKDTRTGALSTKEKEGDLPAEQRYFRIWKKTKPVSHCDSNPCRNGGKCVSDVVSYSCICIAGYSGKNCENATCKSLKVAGRKSGTYNVLLPSGIFEVYCEMDINGGVYTFISKNILSRIQQSDIDSIFTDKRHVLLRLLKPDNSQPYTIIQQYIDAGGLSVQLNAFVNYTQPNNHAASDYLFLGLLPRKYSHEDQIEGLKSNGADVTFRNCDGVSNNYLAFFSINVASSQPIAACTKTKFDINWRQTAVNPIALKTMPEMFFMFTELHFGGCGCYIESSRWISRKYPAKAAAIGLR